MKKLGVNIIWFLYFELNLIGICVYCRRFVFLVFDIGFVVFYLFIYFYFSD